MPRLPENVWQCDRKCNEATEPDPLVREMTALRCKQQRNENANGEKRRGMFVFKTESQQRAEPKPKRWRPAVDNADK